MKFSTMLFLTVIISVLMVGTNVIYVMQKEHKEREILVSEKRIIEAAIECSNNMQCGDFPITIETLIDKGYLENVVNPLTKEYYSEQSFVYMENNEYFIEEV